VALAGVLRAPLLTCDLRLAAAPQLPVQVVVIQR
jgi:predicted nucleic acid-binding protein